jgi:hypothetical protein
MAMQTRIVGTCLLAALVAAAWASPAGSAAEGTGPLLGSPEFSPSPDRPIGWRGDGSVVSPRPRVSWDGECASPLYHDGLLYCLDQNRQLRALDMAEGTVVYQQDVPLARGGGPRGAGFMSSPTLAGKYIYIMDAQGGTLVIEPGRQYKQIALNRITVLDFPGLDREGAPWHFLTAGNPWFEGTKIYIRGEDRMICIGAK